MTNKVTKKNTTKKTNSTTKKTTSKNHKSSGPKSTPKKTATKIKSKKKCNKTKMIVTGIIILAIIALSIIIALLQSEKTIATANGLDIVLETTPDLKIGIKTNGGTIKIYKTQIDYINELFGSSSQQETENYLESEAIIREILYQNAIKEDIVFTKEKLNQLVNHPEFIKQLESKNITTNDFLNKYETEIKKDYFVQEYFNKVILSNIPVKEAIDVSHILICFEGTMMCETNRTKEEALTLAKEIQEMAKNNNNIVSFEQLAVKYSDDASPTNKGNLGTFGRGDMIPEFEEVAFNTPANEISEIVETAYGYHVIRINQLSEMPDSQVAINILMSLREQILEKADIKTNSK